MTKDIDPANTPLTPNLEMTEEELQVLAQQLAKPEGARGQEVAKAMNESNHTMTVATFEALAVNNDDNLLEIGFGNADHVPELLAVASGLRYTGVDISETMVSEAKKANASLTESGEATFHLGNGRQIDFAAGSFQRVFTVNTIYFWEDATSYLQQIEQVMAPGATLAIGYVRSDFLKTLPFTKWGFTFVDDTDINALTQHTSLTIDDILHLTTEVKDASGTPRTRPFSVAKLIKAG